MAQGSYILKNVPDQSAEESFSNYLGINCSHHLEVDNLKCLDDFQHSDTIKRLSLKRRPRVAVNNVEKTQSGISSSQWHSAESLASSSHDDSRLLGMSSTTRGRPPLPPPHGSCSDGKPSRTEGPAMSQVPQPTARPSALQRQIPIEEKTTLEFRQHLDKDVTNQFPPIPHPRRRLASFGGVSSPGSVSPFTGLGAYNHSNNGNTTTSTESDMYVHLSSSMGSRGSTGCLRLSPQSSGRTTPVTSQGSMHLQHVRDQMVVALQRLKELEEQVKIIPILQVKVSVLQEEKRQLLTQLKSLSDKENINDVVWKKADGRERPDKVNTARLEGMLKNDCNNLSEFRKLTEEMQALERTVKGAYFQGRCEKTHGSLQDTEPVITGADKCTALPSPLKESKYAFTDQVEMRSIATEVSEGNLGINSEREAEFDAQQVLIGALKERICQLEAELKESALQTEMSRLKLELQAAGARNRVDKACFARPSTVSTSIEAKPETVSQGVGNHTEVRDACIGEAREVKTVGVSCCSPELKSVYAGPEVPMSHWEVKERVETVEKGVGIHVVTNTQGVGVEVKLCDAETNTDPLPEDQETKKGKTTQNSVACGECSVDVIIYEAKELVSQGTGTDHVRGVDLGIMASPQTTSQRTNTLSSSVSRFTSTSHGFSTDSSTNTILNTKDKHTNTTKTLTRTASVGSSVKDIKYLPQTSTIGVGTADLQGSTFTKSTRDTGVGFTNVHDNFLVGLKTRNMASGPSHLPDPTKTRSIGVGDGKIRDLSAAPIKPVQTFQQSPSQSQWEPELNHYIEKMHRFLEEHGDLLSEEHTHQREGFAQQKVSQGRTSSKSLCNSKAETQAGQDIHPLDAQPPVGRAFQPPPQHTIDSSERETASTQGGNESEVKRMIQMLEQQASLALQDRSANVLPSVTKKQNGDQGCSSSRRNMKFLRVTTGLNPTACYELSASGDGNSEEAEKRGNKKSKDALQDVTQQKKSKSGSSKGLKASANSRAQQRCKLSEKMIAACRALKKHLSDECSLSSRDMHDSVQTLQQEWFSVSSQKSAAPAAVEDYLSAFRVISPAVLRHIVNMADGNGNTALHYSVSHSSFGVVQKLLDAEVCDVNQQNTAGYTPIMLAALAAVRSSEDMRVVEQLFAKGDVNTKASQAGQTALMLAVSHGRMDMVQALLARGAQVNIQDDEGSTALMCASEHGHADIVRLLLAQPDCDANLTDNDESTALSIALEAGHNNIAVLLYAHANFSKGQTPAGASRHCGKSVTSSGGRDVFE
ncbi:uncharacterized protein V6R79_023311 [Siganus canaliculatus]